MAVCTVSFPDFSRVKARVYTSKEDEFDWALSSERDIQCLGRDTECFKGIWLDAVQLGVFCS